MENYNDTITVNSIRTEQEEPQAEVQPQETKKENNHTAAKVAASVVAGSAVGVTADHFAEDYMDSKETGNIADGADVVAQATPIVEDDVKSAAAKEQPAATATHTERTAAQDVDSKADAPANNAQDTNIHQTSNTQSGTPVEMKVDQIQTVVGEDGQVQHIASAHIDGHAAILADDGHGNVVAAGIDANDNNHIDNDEIVDLRGYGMTMGDLASHMTEQGDVQVTSVTQQQQNPDIEVVSIHHDTEIGDVAVVSVNGDNALLVDSNTDGNADYLVHDDNSNNHIEQNEIHHIDSAVTMPTEDDMTGQNNMASNDNLPDYSNDADITTYEI